MFYNPCAPGSRLGGYAGRTPDLEVLPPEISGAHFHTLCEQNADALARTLETFEKVRQQIRACRWINFGGGHHITRKDYDIDLLCSCLTDWRERYAKAPGFIWNLARPWP